MNSSLLNLKKIRLIYQLFFFFAFLILIFLSTPFIWKSENLDSLPYPLSFFLELSPLHSISILLSTGTIYKDLIISLSVIILTLFFGRIFCGWICPLGTLHQFISNIFHHKNKNLKINLYKKIYKIKYFILIFFLISALLSLNLEGFLEPLSLMYRSIAISFLPIFISNFIKVEYSHSWFIGIFFIFLLSLNFIFPRFWCRVLCPLGALLGILSFSPLFKINKKDGCTSCNKCIKNCQGGDEPHKEHYHRECIVCLNCIDPCPEKVLSYSFMGKITEKGKLDLERRSLLFTIFGSFLIPFIIKSSAGRKRFLNYQMIRPPGAIPEDEFLEKCIKCGSCMKICPTNALHPAFGETTFEGIWTPVLIPKIGYCTQNCNLCSLACPSGAIKPFTIEEKISKPIRIGSAVIDPARCLPYAYGTPCIVCEEVCPTSPKAIYFVEKEVNVRGEIKKLKQPVVDLKYCWGCGICENRCPVSSHPAIYVISSGETREEKNKILL